MPPSVVALLRLPRAQLVLAAVLLLNVALLLWIKLDNAQLAAQQDLLSALQSQAQVSATRLTVLRQQTAEAQSRLADLSAPFRKPIDPMVLQEHVVNVAGANGVQLGTLNLAPPTTRTLGSRAPYQAVVLNVQARGNLFALLSFMTQVARSFYPTSSLEGVKVAADQTGWTAQFDLIALAAPQ